MTSLIIALYIMTLIILVTLLILDRRLNTIIRKLDKNHGIVDRLLYKNKKTIEHLKSTKE